MHVSHDATHCMYILDVIWINISAIKILLDLIFKPFQRLILSYWLFRWHVNSTQNSWENHGGREQAVRSDAWRQRPTTTATSSAAIAAAAIHGDTSAPANSIPAAVTGIPAIWRIPGHPRDTVRRTRLQPRPWRAHRTMLRHQVEGTSGQEDTASRRRSSSRWPWWALANKPPSSTISSRRSLVPSSTHALSPGAAISSSVWSVTHWQVSTEVCMLLSVA